MTNLFIKFGFTGLNLPNASYVGGNDVDGASQGWTIQVFQLNDPTGGARNLCITNVVALVFSNQTAVVTTHNPVDWFQFSGMTVPLAPNTVYAYTIVCTQNRGSSYSPLDFGTNTTVVGSSNGVGTICRIAATAATTPAPVTYFPTDISLKVNAQFDLGLALAGPYIVGTPTATPSSNSAFALLSVLLSDSVAVGVPVL